MYIEKKKCVQVYRVAAIEMMLNNSCYGTPSIFTPLQNDVETSGGGGDGGDEFDTRIAGPWMKRWACV